MKKLLLILFLIPFITKAQQYVRKEWNGIVYMVNTNGQDSMVYSPDLPSNSYIPSFKKFKDTVKSAYSLTKSDLSLGNVDNTSDANKPISTAEQTALNLKANLAAIPITSITGYTGYTLAVQALTSSPTDAQTIYFGNIPRVPATVQGTSKIYIRKAGTIKIAEIYCFSGTAGTNEAWPVYIRLNNSGDTQIGSLSVSASERVFTNTSLSIAVAVGDYIEIKCVNPTWVTNPLTTIFGGYIYIE